MDFRVVYLLLCFSLSLTLKPVTSDIKPVRIETDDNEVSSKKTDAPESANFVRPLETPQFNSRSGHSATSLKSEAIVHEQPQSVHVVPTPSFVDVERLSTIADHFPFNRSLFGQSFKHTASLLNYMSPSLTSTVSKTEPDTSTVSKLSSHTPTSTPFQKDVDECLTNNGGCEHVCHNTIGSFYCSCNYGFVLNSNGMNCNDINECSGDNHGCSQTCNNLPGSYKCGCWNGFQIDAEEKDNECRGGVWPSGTYSLPQPLMGCPASLGFLWSTGLLYFDTIYDVPNAESSLQLAGQFNDTIIIHFCTKSTPPRGYPENTWPRGCYCVYKKYICPTGFSEGYMTWDDGSTNTEVFGILPDGVYGNNTAIEFCCRCDADVTMAIDLPRERDFYLMRHKDAASCQEVLGMRMEEHIVTWYEREDLNVSLKFGDFPFGNDSEIHYCYYSPEKCIPKCENGGICSRNNTCICNFYDGNVDSRCRDINECEYEDVKVCRASQYCDNTVGGYECYCKPGYIAIANQTYCERKDVFPTVPLENLDHFNSIVRGLQDLSTCLLSLQGNMCIHNFMAQISQLGHAWGEVKNLGGSISLILKHASSLKVSDLLRAIFKETYEDLLLPFNSEIRRITYMLNSRDHEFIIVTRRSSIHLEIFPGMLELHSLWLQMSLTGVPFAPSVDSTLVKGILSLGNFHFLTEIEFHEEILNFTAQPRGNNEIDLVSLLLSAVRVELNIPFLDKVKPTISDLQLRGQYNNSADTLYIVLEGLVSIGDWFSDHFCLIIQQHLQNVNRKPPAFGIITGCQDSELEILFRDIIHGLFNVDIGNLPLLGDLTLPKFKLIYFTPNFEFHIPKSILPTLKRPELLDIFERGIDSLNFQFFFDFFAWPFKLTISDIIELKPVSFDTPTIGDLLSGISGLQFPSIDILEGFNLLNIRISELDFNSALKCLTFSGALPHTVRLFSNQLSITELNSTISLGLADFTFKTLQIDGKIRVADLILEAQIEYIIHSKTFKLNSCANEINLLDVALGLSSNLIRPSILGNIGINDLNVHHPCLSIDRTGSNERLCVSGEVRLGSVINVNASGCILEDRQWVYGFEIQDFQLTSLIRGLPKEFLNLITLINQEVDISLVVSAADLDAIPLKGKLLGAIEGQIEEGYRIYSSLTWPSQCGIDILCIVAKAVLGDDYTLDLVIDFPSTDIISVKASLEDFALGPLKFSPTSLDILFNGFQPPVVAIRVSLPLNDPPIVLIGGINLKYTPVTTLTLELAMRGCWKKVFNLPVDVCDIFTSVDLSPNPPFVTGLAVGGSIKLGKPSCGSIESKVYVGIDTLRPENNYFYTSVSRLTLQTFINLFCVGIQLPSFLGDTGYNRGCNISYAKVPIYLPAIELRIPAGFYFSGGMSLLGVSAFAELKYNPPSEFFINATLSPISLSILSIYRSSNDHTNGPFFEASFTTEEVSIRGAGYISVLGISTSVDLEISSDKFAFTITGDIFGLLRAKLTVSTTSVTDILSGEFRVYAVIESNILDQINAAIAESFKTTADLADLAVKGAKELINVAQDGLRIANEGLASAERLFGDASRALESKKREIEDLKRRVNSVCHLRDCGQTCIPYPCACGCTRVWTACIPNICTCCGYVTDPACLASNAACSLLKEPIKAALSAAQAGISGLQAGADAARNTLASARSLVSAAINKLDEAKRGLDRVRDEFRKGLDILSKIVTYSLTGIVNVREITFEVALTTALDKSSSININVKVHTCCFGSPTVGLRFSIGNPLSIVSELVNRFTPSVGRRKRSDHLEGSLKPNLTKDIRLREFYRKHGSAFPI